MASCGRLLAGKYGHYLSGFPNGYGVFEEIYRFQLVMVRNLAALFKDRQWRSYLVQYVREAQFDRCFVCRARESTDPNP